MPPLAFSSQQGLGQVSSALKDTKYQADPLTLFRNLSSERDNCLLLESAEISDKRALKSLILVDAALKVVCQYKTVTISALTENGVNALAYLQQVFSDKAYKNKLQIVSSSANKFIVEFSDCLDNLDELSRLLATNPMQVLRELQAIKSDSEHPFAVFVAFDLITIAEQLPSVKDSENSCPDYVFYLAETLIVIDHQQQKTDILGNVFSGQNQQKNIATLESQLQALDNICQQTIVRPDINLDNEINDNVNVNIDDATFCQQVELLKEHIRAGDIFQVVPSRTFSIACNDALDSYQVLKQTNPSPYMFFLKDNDFSLFGASPESALKFSADSRDVELYPIAGTRPRGFRADGSYSADLDGRIELELRNDVKENAEHLMLVDLARNDIARVSVGGTRHVAELLKVDRYSHVMHLVSRVIGKLANNLDALHAYQACMNMGTLSGAPKVRATELIRQVEGQRRGSYGGAVGYINGLGDMDTCIVIRSAFVKNNIAYVQAGAGVVYDSVPQAEADETRQKAQAVIKAVQLANAACNKKGAY